MAWLSTDTCSSSAHVSPVKSHWWSFRAFYLVDPPKWGDHNPAAALKLVPHCLDPLNHMKSLSMRLPVFLALFAGAAFAQTLPPTSRMAYKCEVRGRTVYSDTPCIGAEKLHLEPTKGLNRFSGREVIGNDVRREKEREMFADAVRPLTGMNAAQLDTAGRRQKLSPSAQQECRSLDSSILELERSEKQSTQTALKAVQNNLYRERKRFHDLRC